MLKLSKKKPQTFVIYQFQEPQESHKCLFTVQKLQLELIS